MTITCLWVKPKPCYTLNFSWLLADILVFAGETAKMSMVIKPGFTTNPNPMSFG